MEVDLILRRREAPSRWMNGTSGASWFETREDALLTMRIYSAASIGSGRLGFLLLGRRVHRAHVEI